MELQEFITEERVLIGVAAADKPSLLRVLSGHASAAVGITTDLLADEIIRREELRSTALGRGAAMPHARIGTLTAPVGLFARLKYPIDFGAFDMPVDLVFLLLLPSWSQFELFTTVGPVVKKLRNPRLRAEFRSAQTSGDLYRAITRERSGRN